MFLHELSELNEIGVRVIRAYFGSLAVLVSCEKSHAYVGLAWTACGSNSASQGGSHITYASPRCIAHDKEAGVYALVISSLLQK